MYKNAIVMKTTNVTISQLNYNRYENKKYDTDIRKVIPGYEQLHKEITKIVSSLPKKNLKIADLGAGTGLTAEVILKVLPTAKLTAIDFSETMILGAKKRLANYHVDFKRGDYSLLNYGKNFDMIFSVIGIHHQNNAGKQKVFGKAYSSLKHGGIFLLGDLVTYKDKFKAALNEAKHYAFMVEHLKDEISLREWSYHHKFLNDLAPLEDQIKWLEEAGFSKVEVKYNFLNTALILAKK